MIRLRLHWDRKENGLDREGNPKQLSKLRSSSDLDDNLTTNVEGLEGMSSRNIPDESEFGDEWTWGDNDKVGGVNDDSQVSQDKSLSLQR